jgi:hypothetical protein
MTPRMPAVLFAAVALVSPVVHADEACSMEVKLLLPPSAMQTAINSLGFSQPKASRVDLYDTQARTLAAQGVNIRVRYGANNDLTVKVRSLVGALPAGDSHAVGEFPCEIDRTQLAAVTSHAIERPYIAAKPPRDGREIESLLSDAQRQLLDAAQIRIDWSQVARIVEVSATTWHTSAKSMYGRLALEMWEWPAGRILEISARSAAADDQGYARLEGLIKTNGLTPSPVQATKTGLVLGASEVRK